MRIRRWHRRPRAVPNWKNTSGVKPQIGPNTTGTRQIVAQTEVTLADVRFVADRWVLKTSSGKLAHSANRDKYLEAFL
jgi:hypothetical protein